MKRCSNCCQTKPYEMFYRHPKTADTYMAKCKECTKVAVRKNYSRNRDHYLAYEKKRVNAPHRVAARAAYQKTESGRASAKRGHKKYIEQNPLKRRAQIMTCNALRSGKLTKEPCEICAEQFAQAHHDDYSKPLNVRWLCVRHHAEWHRHNIPKCPDQEVA